MERRLTRDVEITRQTISKWIKHLYKLNIIDFGYGGAVGQYNYFLNGRNSNGDVETKRITKEQYSRAWRIHFDALEKGKGWDEAFHDMRVIVGGVPQKKDAIEMNAFELKRINTLKEILEEEKEPDW